MIRRPKNKNKKPVARPLAGPEFERTQLLELFDQTPAFMAILRGKDYVFERANASYYQLVGHRDIIGRPVLEALPEVKGQGYIELLNRVLKTGKPFYGKEMKIMLQPTPKAALTERYVDFVFAPLIDDNRKRTGIMAHGYDVTDLVVARKKLEESEERFRTLADNIPTLAWMANADGSIFWYNSRWYEYTGTTPAQMEGWGWQSVHDPKMLPEVLKSWKKSIRTKKTFEMTFPLRGANGAFRSFLTRVVPVFGKGKEVVRWFGANTDITEQKKVERALQESEERFRTLIEKSADATQLITPEGKVLYTSDSIRQVLGYTPEEIMGHTIAQYIHPEDHPYVMQRIGELFSNPKESITLQYRVKHKDGSWAWIEATGSNHLDTPNIRALVGNFRNITERKKAEDERRLLEHQKDDFLGIASHELKTPVTSIKAYGQVLQKIFTRKGDEKSTEMLQKMDAQVNRLTSLIGDLLDVTKIQSGNLVLHAEQFDFNTFIKECMCDLQLTTEQHKLVVKLGTTVRMYGDKERLGQVLTNLVSNAIKYSPHAQKIIIQSKKEKDMVTVSVQDFGIGISKTKQPRVFERFYRVSGRKEDTFPGLGLGLYISAQIIKRQGGKIWVESTEGRGSTFYFSLPIKAKLGKQGKNIGEEEIKHE